MELVSVVRVVLKRGVLSFVVIGVRIAQIGGVQLLQLHSLTRTLPFDVDLLVALLHLLVCCVKKLFHQKIISIESFI